MFILTKISDLVQISPHEFNKPSIDAIEDYINAKYANKVIQKIGLCICLYDLLSASEGLIGHGTVEFRIIVFRPFKHEVLFGVISSSSQAGIRIRTDFFDEINVSPSALPEDTVFDHNEQVWIWKQDATGASDLYFDNHESVRFRIESEEWVDQSPLGPHEKEDGVERESPYRIMASMQEPGLGPCLWWDGDDDDEEEDENDYEAGDDEKMIE